MLARAVRRMLGSVKLADKPLAAPEPVYGAPRPMNGLFAQLSNEQRARVLEYSGAENIPCADGPKAKA